MNEVKTADKEDIKHVSTENYKEIKPQNGMTVKMAENFLYNKFEEIKKTEPQKNGYPRCERIEGKKYYFDDNGNLYRVDKSLEANTEYTINRYEYHTDEIGRISSAEGTLYLKENGKRQNIIDSLPDMEQGDHKGHIFANIFNGSAGIENAIPQNARLNTGEYKQFEHKLAAALKEGKEVKVKIQFDYKSDSRRPKVITAITSIDGKLNIHTFQNEKILNKKT